MKATVTTPSHTVGIRSGQPYTQRVSNNDADSPAYPKGYPTCHAPAKILQARVITKQKLGDLGFDDYRNADPDRPSYAYLEHANVFRTQHVGSSVARYQTAHKIHGLRWSFDV